MKRPLPQRLIERFGRRFFFRFGSDELKELLWLGEHCRAAQGVDSSFASESAYLAELRDRLGIDGGWVVDIAASDGVTQSCTLQLFRDPAWRGLAVECDPAKFANLVYAYRKFAGVQFSLCRVTPENIIPLLRAHEVPEDFEILNLDIDSYDYFVAEALLTAYRPVLITMEVNEKIPPPIHFAVRYRADHVWDGGHFYGCSIVAASELLKRHDYVLAKLHYNNAFFVRADRAVGTIPDSSPAEAYAEGYLGQPDRISLFPWNRDMEALLQLGPDEAMAAVEEKFRRYGGQYVLRI